MSAFSGPEISANGLVFYYDTGNTLKSWKGAPTTNLVNPSWASWTVDGSGQGNIGTRTISSTYECTIVDNNANTRQYISIDSGISANTTYTFSVQYKKIYGAPTLRFQIQAYNSTTYLSLMSFATTAQLGITDTDDWQTAKITLTTPASTNRIFWYMQDGDDFTTYTHSFSLKNVQCEQQSFATPFVDGTRSTTQSILDLTNNKTINNQSLTYNSDGTFSFNSASSNYLEIGAITLTNSSYTVDAWIKRSSTGTGHGILSDLQYGWWLFYVSSGDKIVLYHQRNLPSFSYNEIVGTSSIGTNWTYVTGVFDNTAGMRIYVNGIQENSNTSTIPFDLEAGRGPQYIGLAKFDAPNVLGNPFNGQIGILRVFNRALTNSEVRQNFQSMRGRFGI